MILFHTTVIPSLRLCVPEPRPWQCLVSHPSLVTPLGLTQLLPLRLISTQVLAFSPPTLKKPAASWLSCPTSSPHLHTRSARVSRWGINSPPLLWSTIHALNSIGLCVDELHNRMHDLGSQVGNSLIGPHIQDLRNSVSDLSRLVAPLFFVLPLPLRSPPPPNPNSARPFLLNQPLPIPPVRMPMSSMVAPVNLTRLLLWMLLPVGAKAKVRSLPLLPLSSKSRLALRPPHPRVLPLLPVLQGDSRPPGTRLPPNPNAIWSLSTALTWLPPF